MKKIVSFIMCIMACMSTFAEWSGKKNIRYLKAQNNGIHFILEDFNDKFEGTKECSSSFWLSDGSRNYNERVSFLLAAYMSGKSVNISYSECNPNGHISAGSVAL